MKGDPLDIVGFVIAIAMIVAAVRAAREGDDDGFRFGVLMAMLTIILVRL